MSNTDVLIIGAGPTGLVLALWLTRLGVRVRIVDRAPHRSDTSRALVVQARTLEFYRQLGFADAVVSHGTRFDAVNLWVEGERAAHVELGAMGVGRSPYPHLLIFPQDQHETFLIAQLAALGIEVERPVEITGFDPHDDAVIARLRHVDGTVETCTARYLAGCDGAKSFVRHALDIGFAGGTYSQRFYVADVVASGPPMNGELHIAIDSHDFIACFPLKDDKHARLIGTVTEDPARPEAEIGWQHVDAAVLERIHLNVARVEWFSTYHVHHRVAAKYRVDRTFLLGDAAHVHSPVGGQGMNTGIGDAVNLAWKLAAVLGGRADAKILDTYEEERIAFAHKLVATTDQAFAVVTSESTLARYIRTQIAPRAIARLARSETVRRFAYDTVSQTKVNYRHSRFNEGRAGRVRGGDRLPWVVTDETDNFSPLASLDWQVHVYGTVSAAVRSVCEKAGIPLHEYVWSERAAAVGFTRDATYLVRPDGYVALATSAEDAAGAITRYLDARAMRLRVSMTASANAGDTLDAPSA